MTYNSHLTQHMSYSIVFCLVFQLFSEGYTAITRFSSISPDYLSSLTVTPMPPSLVPSPAQPQAYFLFSHIAVIRTLHLLTIILLLYLFLTVCCKTLHRFRMMQQHCSNQNETIRSKTGRLQL